MPWTRTREVRAETSACQVFASFLRRFNRNRGLVLAGNRQVFGLAGLSAVQAAFPTCRRFPVSATSADDGFRSCIPLRDSPGFAPGSLFTLHPRWEERPTAKTHIHPSAGEMQEEPRARRLTRAHKRGFRGANGE